jgi:hypothetical protein
MKEIARFHIVPDGGETARVHIRWIRRPIQLLYTAWERNGSVATNEAMLSVLMVTVGPEFFSLLLQQDAELNSQRGSMRACTAWLGAGNANKTKVDTSPFQLLPETKFFPDSKAKKVQFMKPQHLTWHSSPADELL